MSLPSSPRAGNARLNEADRPGASTSSAGAGRTGGTTGAPGEEDPPPGYLGDGGTPHTIVGSPFGTNVFRIEGPDIAVVAGGPAPADPNLVEIGLFTEQGRLATVAGIEVTRAVYSGTPPVPC